MSGILLFCAHQLSNVGKKPIYVKMLGPLIAGIFLDFFFQVRHMLNPERQATFGSALWSLWKKQDNHLWEQVIDESSQVFYRAMQTIAH